ncbi:MAG: hypothetical protein J2O48_12040 [Solirubrobacterales bacterium]|nr:hypothetical protein [Solirubrobacterales bacterium]
MGSAPRIKITKVRIGAAVLLCALAGALAAAAASAATKAPPPKIDARFHGAFTMNGRVTVAAGIPGESKGQGVTRTWQFQSERCKASVCAQLGLGRGLSGGRVSRLNLRRIGPGLYRGNGSFSTDLECMGRVYKNASQVPYTVSVRLLGRARVGGVWYATAVRATYTNTRRSDHTPCPLGAPHDAASYQGTLQGQPGPAPSPPPTSTTPAPTSTTPVPPINGA